MLVSTAINSRYVGDRRCVIELTFDEVKKLICVDESLLQDIIDKIDIELSVNKSFLN